ncbi:uncharacterized protein LOC113360010 [Papaver somniferum]|uniref:uncharacterized protein LOC113360010 n=1 Tax=Papaver somniferum TaxID=3469 RepID=UPI000E704439|nr:uncharacterized protein LOC113360010 [Papaver somniferum]
MALSKPVWMQEVISSYFNDSKAQHIISQLLIAPTSLQHYTYHHEVLRYKTRLYIGRCNNVRATIIQSIHASAVGGHSGIQATYMRAKAHFFWTKLKQDMSTSYHRQTDGQTKRVNACLENYLRCMTGHQPKQWVQWLTLAEWWYNTSFHTSLRMSPFKALYGDEAPHLAFPSSTTSSVASVEQY